VLGPFEPDVLVAGGSGDPLTDRPLVVHALRQRAVPNTRQITTPGLRLTRLSLSLVNSYPSPNWLAPWAVTQCRPNPTRRPGPRRSRLDLPLPGRSILKLVHGLRRFFLLICTPVSANGGE
jgi:hypothetical protein